LGVGQIATQEYEDVGHSDEADDVMKNYLIGSLVKSLFGFC
jgi:cytochrome b involved in lipid metabolism